MRAHFKPMILRHRWRARARKFGACLSQWRRGAIVKWLQVAAGAGHARHLCTAFVCSEPGRAGGAAQRPRWHRKVRTTAALRAAAARISMSIQPAELRQRPAGAPLMCTPPTRRANAAVAAVAASTMERRDRLA